MNECLILCVKTWKQKCPHSSNFLTFLWSKHLSVKNNTWSHKAASLCPFAFVQTNERLVSQQHNMLMHSNNSTSQCIKVYVSAVR